MNSILTSTLDITSLIEQNQGVVLHSDLEAFWGNRSSSVLQSRIRLWNELGILRTVCRGVFVGREFDPWILACRMYPDAVISTVSVLARHALVGTAPSSQVWCVRLGRTREYTSGSIAVKAWSMDPSLMEFGIEWQGPLRVALPEKAFLDVLHYHMHGRNFPFAVPEDIDLAGLDRETIDAWLPHYRNDRFRTFVRGVLDGR
ncbi:MAG: hypothetical protein RL318_308 [Fibrobacterota bacterium]|jgi:hypothetical protein